MKFFYLFLLFPLTLLAGPREEAAELLDQAAQETNLIVRMDKFSKIFLGLPYGVGGPLGEGPQGRYDQDPLYRFDTFDCTTFVETIVSLARADHVTDFEQKMDEIRYQNGEVDYLKRNHFPSLQWVPYNVTNGILKESNSEILPLSGQKLAEAEINLPGWLRKIKLEEIKVPMATEAERTSLMEELHQLAPQYSPVIAQMRYIPISTLLTRPGLLKKIANGSIVNFVRPNWDLTEATGTHMNVSHQGLLFWKGNVLWQRHASTSGTVSEIPFIDYLKKFQNHATLKGVHFMRVKPLQ